MENQEINQRSAPSWSMGQPTGKKEKSDFYSLQLQHMKQAEWINFVLKTGVQQGFALITLSQLCYQPDSGIRLVFRHAMVEVNGRQLDKLYELLLARKIKEIREFGTRLEHEMEETELFVSSIEIQGDYTVH